MFSVLFEVLPYKGKTDIYLEKANLLRPELEGNGGFIDNIPYRSLIREGWMISVSNWRDEKSLVRWRTQGRYHEVQQIGRDTVFADYHIRVGQITTDSELPADQPLPEQRLDETEAGSGTTLSMITAKRPADWTKTDNPYDCAEWLGLDPYVDDRVTWDIYEAVLTPGELLLVISWPDSKSAQAYETINHLPDVARLRTIRVVRDYGKYERREAPQYFPAAAAENETRLGEEAPQSIERPDAHGGLTITATKPQATAGGDLGGGQIRARAGTVEFPIGKAEDQAGAPAATPYDLLSASLAACTAMTIRFHARRKHYALSHVEVAVSYRQGGRGERGIFERIVTLEGSLNDSQRARLLDLAEFCPVGQTFSKIADIRTREDNDAQSATTATYTNYEEYLAQLPVVNIDP